MSGERSDEKRIESWDNVRNAFEDIRKRYIDWLPWHRRILERYNNGSLSIHIHIRGTLAGVAWTGCLKCDSVEGLSDRNSFGTGGVAGSGQGTVRHIDGFESNSPGSIDCYGNLVRLDMGDGQQRQPVLVNVYEVGEQSERLIPSLIGLHPLDHINHICGEGKVSNCVLRF